MNGPRFVSIYNRLGLFALQYGGKNLALQTDLWTFDVPRSAFHECNLVIICVWTSPSSSQLGPDYTLVINSVKVARELMEKKSAIYADRPRMSQSYMTCLVQKDYFHI